MPKYFVELELIYEGEHYGTRHNDGAMTVCIDWEFKNDDDAKYLVERGDMSLDFQKAILDKISIVPTSIVFDALSFLEGEAERQRNGEA